MATLFGGKVMLEEPGQHRTASRGGGGELRTYTQVRLRAAIRLLEVLARLLSELLTIDEPGESGFLDRVRAFIRSKGSDRLTTQDVAGALGLNVSYFCRQFRRHTGETFHAFLARERVESAKQALLASTESITTIGISSGFQSVSDFNRVFKALQGVTPTEFRRRGA